MKYYEMQKEYMKLHKQLWDVVTKFGVPHECFDCGKKLHISNAVIMCDQKGFLFFCHKDAFARMDVKVFWRRVFNSVR